MGNDRIQSLFPKRLFSSGTIRIRKRSNCGMGFASVCGWKISRPAATLVKGETAE
jgi:hypothetical protein